MVYGISHREMPIEKQDCAKCPHDFDNHVLVALGYVENEDGKNIPNRGVIYCPETKCGCHAEWQADGDPTQWGDKWDSQFVVGLPRIVPEAAEEVPQGRRLRTLAKDWLRRLTKHQDRQTESKVSKTT